MNKKTLFKTKPTRNDNIDNWVGANGDTKSGHLQQDTSIYQEPRHTKRLTIDIPVELHCRFKAYCASRGIVMADKIRDLLEGEFSEVK
jgi:hypothetical protein